ncbi:MAG: gliding motility-associated C-terminal domain-containing protein [Sphingobacteriales bacterium]
MKGFSAVFVVTSNADSGPGTLRDVLTQAAANGQANTINFNLPGNTVDDRTITILSSLPSITSSITIDGTTQSGRAFGVSDTKIRVISNFYYAPGGLHGILQAKNCDNIEIYGMWISAATQWGYLASIFTSHCNNIHIGAPSKGNLIENVGPTIDTGKFCYFQHNICFSDTLGQKPGAGQMIIEGYSNLTIGGDANSGNMIAGGVGLFLSDPTGNNLNFSFNKLGTNFTANAAPDGFELMGIRLNIEGPINNNGQSANVPVNAVINNNIFADVYADYMLRISGFSGKFVIQGNSFNTDLNGNYNFNLYSHSAPFAAILVQGNETTVIGGENSSEKNIIAYCSDGVQYNSVKKLIVTRNSIYCYGEAAVYPQQTQPPTVKINSIGNGTIVGTSTPHSTIELFNADCTCTLPGPKNYFATVTADVSGNWTYDGMVSGYVMASATLDSLTGQFAGIQIDQSKVKTHNSFCGNDGSITGILSQFKSDSITWYDSNNNIVAKGTDLINASPGTYTAKIDFGNSCGLTSTYTIQDYSVKIDTTYLKKIEPSCNLMGSVIDLHVISANSNYTVQWANQNGKIICNCTDLSNVVPGTYTFTATSSNGACTTTYGPITLKNTTGPNIDQSHIKTQATNCGQSTGSITNIPAIGTGILQYSWVNSQQQVVSTDSILVNQPAGTYTLQVTDNTQCGPVSSSAINIPETNGITMDESKAATTQASCGNNNGSVTGIQITGATQYQWMDANYKIIGTSADLQNVPADTYTLTASNGFGCSKTSKAYTVSQQAATKFPDYAATYTMACNLLNNGGVSVAVDQLVKSERWVDASGNTMATGAALTNVNAGTYQLYLTDQNGCENFYKSYTITSYPEFTVANYAAISDDECGLNNGGIGETTINGGIPPYVYTWHDVNNKQIANTNAITNLAAGTYILDVVDGGCGHVDITYTVNSQSENLAAPSVSNLQLCSSGSTLLSVNNPLSSTTYRLYDSPIATQPLQEQKGGYFTVNVLNNHNYYISQLNGSCESERAELQVTVGLSTLNIANAFSPNGDCINDYWQISNIENYPNALVQIFNRYGQKLFESKGYSTPFDGTYNGQKLAAGVYYYIINLNSKCNLLSGSLTILR